MYDDLAGLTDLELVSLVKKNNAEAFVELTSRYLSLIRAKAAPFHTTAMDADDLCQEGLMGLLSSALTFKEGGSASFKTYAGVCIANRVITAYRAAAGQKNLPLNNFVSLNDDVSGLRFTSDQVINPETLLIDREDLQIVKSRIEQTLSKMEQQVLSLYLGGYSYQEISARLNISVKAADNAIQRIRRKLKKPF